MASQFITISIYTLKTPRKSSVGNVDIDQLINNNYNKLVWYAGIQIDLLTIVLGTKLYDLELLAFDKINNCFSQAGYISFRIESLHLGNVMISSRDSVMELYKDKIPNIENIDTVIIQPNTNAVNIKNKTFEKENKQIILIKNKSNNDTNKCCFIIKDKEIKDNENVRIESALIDFFIMNVYNMIYNGNKDTNNNNNNNDSDDHKIIGYFYLRMSDFLQETIHSIHTQMTKLFNLSRNEPLTDVVQYIPHHQYSSKIEIDILWQGQIIGKIKSFSSIQNVPAIIQFPYGIFTEKGIFFHSFSLFRCYSISKGNYASFTTIKERLINVYNSLQNKIKDINDNHKLNSQEPLEYKKLSGELNEIKELFDESISCDYKLYYYHKLEDIYEAQKLILDIGNFIFSILNNITQGDIMTAFDIFQLVSERDEFEQRIIGDFWLCQDTKTNKMIIKPEIIQYNLLEKFILFQRNTIAFSKFSDDSPEDDDNKKIPQSRLYLNKLMSINFFKVQVFRKNLIKSLFQRANYNSSQRIEYLQYDKDKIDYYPESQVLYWNLYLSKNLNNIIKQFALENQSIQEMINDIHKQSTKTIPFIELTKKDTFNFDLIKNILQLTIDKLTKENPKHFFSWLSISSFPNLLNAILYELSNKEISEYPANVIEVITFFAHHQRIINIFLNIIIKKTNVYETTSVYFVLDLLHALFVEHIKKRNSVYNIDYTLLYNAFNIIANVDNCLNIAKMLWIYYSYAHVMPNYHIIDVVYGIFKKKFFDFTFHWSWKIRKIWFVLLKFILLYRLNEKIKYSEVYNGKVNDDIYQEDSNDKKCFKDVFGKEMNVINDIKAIYLGSEKKFDLNENNNVKLIEEHVPKELWINVEPSIKEYLKIEKEFNQWKLRKVSEKFHTYPIVVIPPIKDDIDM